MYGNVGTPLAVLVAGTVFGVLGGAHASSAFSREALPYDLPADAKLSAVAKPSPLTMPTIMPGQQAAVMGDAQSESVVTQDTDGHMVTKTTTCENGKCTTVTKTGKAKPGMLVPKMEIPDMHMPMMEIPAMQPMGFGFHENPWFGSARSPLDDSWLYNRGNKGNKKANKKNFGRSSWFGRPVFALPGADMFKKSDFDFGMKFPKGTSAQSFDHFSSDNSAVDSRTYVKDGKVYEKIKRCTNGKCTVETHVKPLGGGFGFKKLQNAGKQKTRVAEKKAKGNEGKQKSQSVVELKQQGRKMRQKVGKQSGKGKGKLAKQKDTHQTAQKTTKKKGTAANRKANNKKQKKACTSGKGSKK
eukprot:TRINITY_DN49233_c0_g1_i1.p1 TRINITY_DN49233_c0_g1~~TRINITY_DN49233_c0_g1_i1.p1  ORF type:complete len:356 (-),score=80.37 TRINITY_DN49233_c0_g1_i1:111-1178(-)